MFLTFLRERNIAFASALLFNRHPVGKRRSLLPTGGRIIARFSPFSRANLPSNAAPSLCPVFYSAPSTQHSALYLKRIPVAC